MFDNLKHVNVTNTQKTKKRQTVFHLTVNLLYSISETQKDKSYFFLQQAVKDEDEHPLQSVEDGKEVSHHYRGLIEKEQAKGPRQPQKTK